jgi:hypothetical protein
MVLYYKEFIRYNSSSQCTTTIKYEYNVPKHKGKEGLAGQEHSTKKYKEKGPLCCKTRLRRKL